MRPLSFVCAGLVSLFVATAAPAADFTVPVDETFSEASVEFRGTFGEVYTFVWNVFADQGQFAVCGSGKLHNHRFRQFIPKIARDGEVRVAGKVYKVDFNYFTQVKGRTKLENSVATCRFIGPAPNQTETFELRFAPGTFRG